MHAGMPNSSMMVPPVPRKVDRGSRDSSAAGCAQAAFRATYRRRIEYPRDFAWLWAEGWPGDAEEFRSADPRVGCGSGDIGARCHSDAFGPIGFEGRVRKATQGCAGNCG